MQGQGVLEQGAERVDPLGDTERVVVHVAEPVLHVVVHAVLVGTAEQPRDHRRHRGGGPLEREDLAEQLVDALRDPGVDLPGEQLVLDGVDLLLQDLDDGAVAVDDLVEHGRGHGLGPLRQELRVCLDLCAAAPPGRVGRRAGHSRRSGRRRTGAPRRTRRCPRTGRTRPAGAPGTGCRRSARAWHAGVPCGVLDGVLVQIELVGYGLELARVGPEQPDPRQVATSRARQGRRRLHAASPDVDRVVDQCHVRAPSLGSRRARWRPEAIRGGAGSASGRDDRHGRPARSRMVTRHRASPAPSRLVVAAPRALPTVERTPAARVGQHRPPRSTWPRRPLLHTREDANVLISRTLDANTKECHGQEAIAHRRHHRRVSRVHRPVVRPGIPPTVAVVWWLLGAAGVTTAWMRAIRPRRRRRTRTLALSGMAFVAAATAAIALVGVVAPARADASSAVTATDLSGTGHLVQLASQLRAEGGSRGSSAVSAAREKGYSVRSGLEPDWAGASAYSYEGADVVSVPLLGTDVPEMTKLSFVTVDGEDGDHRDGIRHDVDHRGALRHVAGRSADQERGPHAGIRRGAGVVDRDVRPRLEAAEQLASSSIGISWAVIAVLGVACGAACATMVLCAPCLAAAAGFTTGTIAKCVSNAWS